MENYNKWETRKATVDILRLDKVNPRLPLGIRNLKQNNIRDYLVRNEDVDKIAKSIVNQGFMPFKPIFVFKDGEHFTVLEGNRRTCALQLLRDPEKAPAEKQKYYKSLAKKISPENFEKINVIIAPSRSALRHFLYLEHATSGQKKWDRQQKGRFIAEAIFEGKTIEDIAADLGENVSAVSTAVLEVMLQEYFSELDLEPEVLEKATSDDFPLSTATRIINSRPFRDWTKLQIEGSSLKADMDEGQFRAILTKIATDLLTPIDQGGQNSRTLDGNKQMENYVKELKTRCSTTPTSGTKLLYTPQLRIRNRADEERPKRSRKPQQKLISREYRYVTGLSKLDMIIEQAQNMPAGQHPVASALLLRTILELSAVRLFDKHGEINEVVNSNGRSKNLSVILDLLVKNKKSWFSEPQYLMELERFCLGGSNQYIHMDILNRYAHGPYNLPDKDTLQSIWAIIEPLVLMCHDET